MIDQASELRKLVLRAMRDGQTMYRPPPRLVLMTSGRSGVGVTSLSVNVSVALAEQGMRVVLVDTDATGCGAPALCGLSGCATAADLLVARRDIHEVLQRGPAGIQIVPGLRTEASDADMRPLAVERLVRQFTKLGRHADSVIVDVGHGGNDLVRRLSQSADDIIIVTAPDNDSIADAYAHIKLTLSGVGGSKLWLVVNMVLAEPQANDVYQRIRQSCERFLGHSLRQLGFVPLDSAVTEAVQLAVPFVLGKPKSGASRAIQQIATELVSSVAPIASETKAA